MLVSKSKLSIAGSAVSMEQVFHRPATWKTPTATCCTNYGLMGSTMINQGKSSRSAG